MKNLHKLRVDKQLKQDVVAEELGFSKTTIQEYEAETRGKNIIRAIKKTASYFGVSSDYLLGITSVPDSMSEEEKQLAYRIKHANSPELVQHLLGILDEFDRVIEIEKKRVAK